MKATTIMNKSFLDESLKTVSEVNNASLSNSISKHKSRSIKSNLKGTNNTKRHSKEQPKRNQPTFNKDNKKLCESCMTMNVLSQYKP